MHPTPTPALELEALLREIRLKDFLVFKDVSLRLGEGLNVLSGETGAGKSLIVDAILTLLGREVDWSALRGESYLQMVWEDDGRLGEKLRELGIPYEGEVIVRKVLNARTRRSRTFINDMRVSAKVVKEVFSDEILIGEQFALRRSVSPHFQTLVFDRAAGVDYGGYGEVFQTYRKLKASLSSLQKKLDELKEKEDYLRFQLAEMEKLNLQRGEEERLLSRRAEIEGKLREREWAVGFKSVYPIIEENLSSLLRNSPERFRETLEEVYEKLRDILYAVDYGDYEELMEELDSINSRLYQIDRLKARFRTDFEGLLSLREEISQNLNLLQTLEGEKKALEEELEKVETTLREICEGINAQRRAALGDFKEKVVSLLRDLGFSYVLLDVVLKEREFYALGNSQVEMRISTIPSLPPQDVSNLSGGELARFSLVLFSLGSVSLPTVILDEIDIGVSPDVASRIGLLLKGISQRSQVIVITHNAFTAMYADRHFTVKRVSPEKTHVKEVKGEERWEELARMLGVKDAKQILTKKVKIPL